MRTFLTSLLLVVAGVCFAQTPDVRVKLDGIGSFRTSDFGPASWRYYSLFGRPSVVAIRFTLETGFTGLISQKLQRIPHDGDPDQIDQAYIEDEGIWRVGKQVIPFGSGDILRDSVLAARTDTTLIVERVPLSAAICDSGAGRQRGLVGRIGPHSYGFSFAVGQHFGCSGASLTQIRLPNETGGIGHGWSDAYGADVTRKSGEATWRAEYVNLKNGGKSTDLDVSLFDVSVLLRESSGDTLLFGFTRENQSDIRIFRIQASTSFAPKVFAEPYIRFRNARLWDLGVELHVKL